jgi:hypothetical protein
MLRNNGWPLSGPGRGRALVRVYEAPVRTELVDAVTERAVAAVGRGACWAPLTSTRRVGYLLPRSAFRRLIRIRVANAGCRVPWYTTYLVMSDHRARQPHFRGAAPGTSSSFRKEAYPALKRATLAMDSSDHSEEIRVGCINIRRESPRW